MATVEHCQPRFTSLCQSLSVHWHVPVRSRSTSRRAPLPTDRQPKLTLLENQSSDRNSTLRRSWRVRAAATQWPGIFSGKMGCGVTAVTFSRNLTVLLQGKVDQLPYDFSQLR
eukprot:3583824-Rhodomonas_salina.2